MCYLTDFKKGSGVRITDGTKLDRVMKPDRDVAGFLSLTKELGLDPLKAPVTCPMSFGWGGAMGSLDFIPSTWLTYKSKLEKITGKPSSPWSTDDAFLMAGMYLSESGAKSKEEKGEHDAGMIYFSGSTTSLYTWYADGALKIASKIQKDIGIISH
jgi:hypothetical protein